MCISDCPCSHPQGECREQRGWGQAGQIPSPLFLKLPCHPTPSHQVWPYLWHCMSGGPSVPQGP